MIVPVITPASPAWRWILALLESAMRREAGADCYQHTKRLDLAILAPHELRALGAIASRARGEN